MRLKLLVIVLVLIGGILGTQAPTSAKMLTVGGKPANLHGYVSQSLGFSTEGDNYDTEKDLNQAIMNVFLEGDVRLSSELSFYAAGMLTTDWIYPLKSSDSSWNEKRFDQSRDELFMDDEWWQLLKEAHVTWTPGNLTFRLGKQVTRWGEMIVFAVNDVIMPTDETHGFTEMELETLYIPIPIANVRYDFDAFVGPFQGFGLQFIFNPNVEFIPNRFNVTGNDQAGIWAADVVDSEFLGFPVRIGRDDVVFDDPDAFDSDFFEYGLRLDTRTDRSLFSVMGFYGRNNDISSTITGLNMADSFLFSDSEGNPIVNLVSDGVYAREMFVGAAWSYETPFTISGVNPMISFEAAYRFDDVFRVLNGLGQPVSIESDKFVSGVGVNWKVKVPWQKSYFSFMAEARYNRFMDKDVVDQADGKRESVDWAFDAYTTYKKWNLEPGLFIASQSDGDLVMVNPYIGWVPSSNLRFSLGYYHFTGQKVDEFGFSNKDSVALKATWQF